MKKNRKNSTPGRGELLAFYKLLLRRFGHRKWWPGETPFEVCIGAILTQNTAWTNVEKAINNLKKAGLMEPAPMLDAGRETVAECIRPSGYYNVKSARLLTFVRHLVARYDGDIRSIAKLDAGEARLELLSLNGIGMETADSILLYAAGVPIFVVDAYTKRIFSRVGWIEQEDGYEKVQGFFSSRLEPDAGLFNDYHAQIVELAKRHCTKKAPSCGDCPVISFCAEGSVKTL